MTTQTNRKITIELRTVDDDEIVEIFEVNERTKEVEIQFRAQHLLKQNPKLLSLKAWERVDH